MECEKEIKTWKDEKNKKSSSQNRKLVVKYQKSFEAWLSLVERCVRDAEVAGSNPVAPIYLIKSSRLTPTRFS